MKKIIFFGFLLISTIAKGQVFGIKGGLAQSWLRGDNVDADTFERRNGGYVGVFLEISRGKYAIQPELIFSTEGGSVVKRLSEEATTTELKIHSNSLRIPILVKIRPFPKITVEGGPEVTYRFSGKSVNFADKQFSSVAYNSIDFGFDLGGTYNFKPQSPTFFIEARWTNNFLKLLNNSKVEQQGMEVSSGNKLRSSIGQIGVGYKF